MIGGKYYFASYDKREQSKRYSEVTKDVWKRAVFTEQLAAWSFFSGGVLAFVGLGTRWLLNPAKPHVIARGNDVTIRICCDERLLLDGHEATLDDVIIVTRSANRLGARVTVFNDSTRDSPLACRLAAKRLRVHNKP